MNQRPFAGCRARLELEVGRACAREREWSRRIVAGVYAALEYAAADPAAALVLTERATVRWKRREPEFTAMVERFARRLARGAPAANPRLPDPETVVVCLARQVNQRIEAGRAAQMMEIAPDLAFLALLPFVGYAGAQRCSQPTAVA